MMRSVSSSVNLHECIVDSLEEIRHSSEATVPQSANDAQALQLSISPFPFLTAR